MPDRTLASPLYAILDTAFCKGRGPLDFLREFLTAGVKLVQLRAKDLPSNEIFALAHAARELTRSAGATLIINDRVDIALAVGAEGVHLGQDDLPLAAAKKIAGDRLLIGISTHNLAQAKDAEAGGADYIGFGPIFGTTTKQTGHSPRGLDRLREIRNAVKIPIVAIGGIKEKNVCDVWNAGADSAAIISDLIGAENVAAKVKRILSLTRVNK
jgi:thiamine-phosphate pyrophosphorylase